MKKNLHAHVLHSVLTYMAHYHNKDMKEFCKVRDIVDAVTNGPFHKVPSALDKELDKVAKKLHLKKHKDTPPTKREKLDIKEAVRKARELIARKGRVDAEA